MKRVHCTAFSCAAIVGCFLVTCRNRDSLSPATPTEGKAEVTPAVAQPIKPAIPMTESSDIKVRVLAVKNPKEQSIDTSSGTTRSSIYAKEGARLVYVSFGITPKQATRARKPDAGSKPTAVGSDSQSANAAKSPKADEKKDAGIAESFSSMVLRDGDWLFASPFANLREDPDGTGWAAGAAVIEGLTACRSGSGKMDGGFGGVDNLTIPLQKGVVISMRSLVVGQESLITLGFFVGKDARKATVRIAGCADTPISLDDWGKL
jgi:hypothetical protein